MATFDRIDWHNCGDYPENLPAENGGTHIGIYLAWIIENDLIGDLHRDDSQEALQKVLDREITGRDFLIEMCDEKFWDEDLNEEGIEFTKYYYESEVGSNNYNFLEDYAEALGEQVDSLYEIEDSWENYYKLKLIIDKRYNDWRIKK